MVTFQQQPDNPFGLLRAVSDNSPTFADIDGEGDLDGFVGELFGNTVFFRNTGSPTRPSFFDNPQTNPFGLSKVGLDSSPTFADIDKDGDLDAFIGAGDGNTKFFLNTITSVGSTPPLSGAGGQQQFAVASGDGTVNISN